MTKYKLCLSQCEFLNSVIADLQRKLETAETMAGLHGPIPIDDAETGDYRYTVLRVVIII